MIFFVDHDAKSLPPIHHYCAPRTLGSMLATDQMPLYQHLPVQRRKVLQTFRERFLHFRKRCHMRPDQVENRTAFSFLRPARERTLSEIARESNPAADDNLVMRSFTAQP